MKILETHEVWRDARLHIQQSRIENKAGETTEWRTIHRNKDIPGAVGILAVTTSGNIVMVKNWRLVLKGYQLELPAGLLDKPGLTPFRIAVEELEEEAGYTLSQKSWTALLGTGLSSAGLTDEAITWYFANNVVPAPGGQKLEKFEEITPLEVPVMHYANLLERPPEPCLGVDARIGTPFIIARSLGLI